MHTFYVPPSHIDTNTVTITGSEQHHLRNVLRIVPGKSIRIIDGKGNVYIAETLASLAHRSSSEARIHTHKFHPKPSPTLVLFQGIPKNDKMELILQKTTELGVTQIVPLHSERAFQKPSQRRYARWHRIVISATKQCKRAWLPKLSEAQQFEAYLTQLKNFSLRLLLSPRAETQHIKTVLQETCKTDAVAVFVGPEGGFSDQEITAAIGSGCIPVTLGANVLRTETAAIAAVAVTAYEYQL